MRGHAPSIRRHPRQSRLLSPALPCTSAGCFGGGVEWGNGLPLGVAFGTLSRTVRPKTAEVCIRLTHSAYASCPWCSWLDRKPSELLPSRLLGDIKGAVCAMCAGCDTAMTVCLQQWKAFSAQAVKSCVALWQRHVLQAALPLLTGINPETVTAGIDG